MKTEYEMRESTLQRLSDVKSRTTLEASGVVKTLRLNVLHILVPT